VGRVALFERQPRPAVPDAGLLSVSPSLLRPPGFRLLKAYVGRDGGQAGTARRGGSSFPLS